MKYPTSACAVAPSGSVTVMVTVVMTGLGSIGTLASTHAGCADSLTWLLLPDVTYVRVPSTPEGAALSVTVSASPSGSVQVGADCVTASCPSVASKVAGLSRSRPAGGGAAAVQAGAAFAGALLDPSTLWFACAASPAWVRPTAKPNASRRVAPLPRTTSVPSSAGVTATPSVSVSSSATV